MKHRFLAVIPVLALLGAVFGYAASLDIGAVDSLGSGTEDILPPEVEVTSVTWGIDNNNYKNVAQVNVIISAIDWTGTAYGPYDFYFVLKDSGGNVLKQTYQLNQLVDGHDGWWEFEWLIVPSIPAADIAVFAITVIEEVE